VLAVGFLAFNRPRSNGLPGVLENSIAVLPFENLSPDQDNAYYAAGLHEEILNQLSKLKSLNVVSRTSVLRYAENRPPIPEIAEELNVQTIMEGSVRFAGDRIRVTAQLIDARKDRHVWSETYDSNFGDVFGMESDIAMNVANSMALQFSLDEQEDLLKVPTDSPEAYALFLQAWNTGGIGVADDALLDRALVLDPEFALAHALKALINVRRLINIQGIEGAGAATQGEIEELVSEHATRAIEIDANVPYAHAALAALYRYQWHWNDAIDEYGKAIEAVPNDLSARQGFAWTLGWLGRHDEAIEQARLGVTLNPLSANALYYLAVTYAYAGKYDDALGALRRAQQLIPTNPVVQAWVGFMETARRNHDAAIRELRYAEELLGDNPSTVVLPELAYAYSLLGQQEDVGRLYAAIESRAETNESLGSGTWVQTYLATGDRERALMWLEMVADEAEKHVIDQGALNVLSLKVNYMNDPALEEPRFAEVFGRIGGS
jgi:TolB-like protein